MVAHLLPVLVAAVAAFLLGAVWYSPLLFARQWVAAHGYTPEKLELMKTTTGRAYGVSFVCFLVMAAILRVFFLHLGVDSVMDGVKWSAHVWLGFVATVGLTANMYSDKPLATYLIDAGYQLVYLLAMGAILGAWHSA